MYIRCSKDGFCKALLDRCQATNTKGFVKREYINIKTGKNTGAIIAFSKGKGDRGLALNFCPFCGFSFYDLYQKGTLVGGGKLEDISIPENTGNLTGE